MSISVSSLLSEKYGIDISPGGKGECPFCRHRTFSVKRDDTIGKCFHGCCGQFIAPSSNQPSRANILDRLMVNVFQVFHANLLSLASEDDRNAYSYIVQERGVHPRVVADSMLGAVPPDYNCASIFEPAIAAAKAAVGAAITEHGGEIRVGFENAQHDLEILSQAQVKFHECTEYHKGWIAFFYSDSSQHIVAVRFRKPYSKRISYFKPYKIVTGLFGHGLFGPVRSDNETELDDFLIVTEGEFNQLQLQSLSLRYGEITGRDTGYIFACSVGGVNNADHEVIRQVSRHPIFCYDNDSSNAGLALVNKARGMMSVSAFTTPHPDSDLDSFIRSFGDHYKTAWEAIRALVAGRKTLPREYSRTGREFLRGNTFIPKRLADAILEQNNLRYDASRLWTYTNGVYRPNGESLVRGEAQALLGEERRESRINETLRYIETATGTTVFEPNMDFINLENGRLDWRAQRLELHSPGVFEIVQLPVMYDAKAVCPFFDHYLETTVEPEIVPLVEEIIGYCLIPDTRFEKAVMLVGSGANGKSVLLDTMTALCGNENISNIALQDLEENRFRVAEIYGKLANLFADLDDRALNSSAVFKTLVSGDRITAERKFAQPFVFRPYARLIFSANDLPAVRDRTHAFYRRWIVIPFKRTFTSKSADKNLRAKLHKELPGILNRGLNGLRRLFSQGGFSEPEVVKAAVAEYQRENDTVASFVMERVTEEVHGTIEKKGLYAKYLAWCETQGLCPVAQKQLKTSLKNIFPGLDEVRTSAGNGPWHWVGIRLMDDAQDFGEQD